MTTQPLVSQIADVMLEHRLETASTRCTCGETLYGKASPAGFAEHMAEDVRRRVFNKVNLATHVLAVAADRDALVAKVARVEALLIGAVLVDADALRTALDASETP